jgi:predicted AAA+ superfamily ATPase
VYLELRRRGGAVSYYVTESGFEVDFFVERDDGTRELVQACADTSEPATLERELRALYEAMAARKLDTATIVTSFDERQLRAAGRTIRLVPAWRWMLERA